MTDDMCVDIA